MHTVTLNIDNRERDLCDKDFSKCNADVGYCNLLYGDILIKIDDKELLVVERKTLSDLAASIKDGRYKNQKTALLSYCRDTNIYYIIEGEFDYSDHDVCLNGISKQTLVSCIINSMVRDNIKIVFTKDVNDTYNFVFEVLMRIGKDPAKYITKSMEKVVIKKEAKTKEEMFINQLCQIPDISSKTAKVIASKYDSLYGFYNKFQDTSYEEKMKILSELKTVDTNGKSRKISEKAIKNVIEYMF